MKPHLSLIVILQVVAGAALLVTMLVYAGHASGRSSSIGSQPGDRPELLSSDEPVTESDSSAEAEAESELDSDAPKSPPPTTQQLLEGLLAISPPGGVQLPPAAEQDQSDWLSVDVGYASMLVPPGWTIQNQIGEKDAEDQTVGLSPPSNEIYVELRQIRNADSNYEQTPADIAQSDYRRSPDRLKEKVIFGFQPMVIDGAVGTVEIMNQFGKDKNEDGTPTFRMIFWHGRWEQNDAIQKVEFTATFAQDQYEEMAPLVSSILSTIKIGKRESDK